MKKVLYEQMNTEVKKFKGIQSSFKELSTINPNLNKQFEDIR